MFRRLHTYFTRTGVVLRWDLRRRARLILAVTALGTLSAGCDTTGPAVASLRIHNGGATPLSALTVSFPEAQVAFGDVPAGAVTAYHVVPGGVYGYAAYRFTHEGRVVRQPVIDWVGEEALEGRTFTYTVELITTAQGDPWINLLDVARDR